MFGSFRCHIYRRCNMMSDEKLEIVERFCIKDDNER